MCVCVCVCVCVCINETMMTDCTIKDSPYVCRDRFHVFLFGSEQLVKHKHLKPVASHLDAFFLL